MCEYLKGRRSGEGYMRLNGSRKDLPEPVSKPTFGSMTSFVLIATQSVKDFLQYFSLFS